MASFPQNYLDLADQKVAFASLATLMPDGTPQVTPVWFDYTNGLIRVNTATGRVKANNMQVGAAVALSILDPDNPYRYVQVRGKVTHTTRDGADAHIDALSHKYMGKDYPFRKPGEDRILVEITIDHASASG
jgi:PPOX class probable F420-dependent enzyme